MQGIENITINCNEPITLEPVPLEPVPIFHNLSVNNDSVESDKIDEHVNCNLNVRVESDEQIFYKNQRIHPAIPCNKLEAMQMILIYFMRHNLTFVALEDVIKLINNILKLEALPTSKYKFFKLFSDRYNPTNVFFCKQCSNEIEVPADSNTFVICDICQTSNTCSSTTSDNYFVTLPIVDQLKEIVSNKLAHFVKPTSNSLTTSTTIADITDGAIYKKLQTCQRKITLTLNTDGVQIVKSKSKSLWPIQATINELPPEERFLSKNILLLGLWYNEKHPEMQILLKPFVLELVKLKSSGMEVDVNQQKINFDVSLICGSFDGPAKAAVQNLTQHNGYYSCHYCEHRGEAVSVNDGGTLQVRYPIKGCVKKRTAKEAISNMKEASQISNKLPVKGKIT